MEKLVKLMPHNFEAYMKVKEQFKVSDRACVVHATGTGKSYIIAATAEDYDKVLILAPNDYVLSELKKIVGKNCKLMTYDGLIVWANTMKGLFDLIVFDEFHKMSIPKWLGISIEGYIKRILEINPAAKLLGTTTTEIRISGRNMADEMFDGNVVSRLTLPMAWSQRILRVPTYVTGLYTFDNIDKDVRGEIINSSKSKEERRIFMTKLDNWINNHGVSSLIKRHINPNSRRIVVYCDKIQHISEIKNSVKSWLIDTGLKIHKLYTVNSQNCNERSKKDDMLDFEKNDGFLGVKIMFISNMINLKIHIKNIDAVIMVRSARSKALYFQQMGSFMISDNIKPLVIFDLVDDIGNTDQIVAMQEELNRIEDERLVGVRTVNGYTDRVSFDIVDYMMETRELLEKLESRYSYKCKSFEKNLIDLREFIKVNNRLPTVSNGEVNEVRLKSFIDHYKSHHEILLEIRQIRAINSKFIKNLSDLKEFVKEKDRLPQSKNGKDEGRLRGFVSYYKSHPEVSEIIEKYRRK